MQKKFKPNLKGTKVKRLTPAQQNKQVAKSQTSASRFRKKNQPKVGD